MSFRVKFNLVLLLTFALALLLATAYYKNEVQKATLEEVKHEARLSLQAALAIRSYSSQHVRADLNQEQFKPDDIPAFVTMETMRLLFEKYPGYQYSETVLNPLNLANMAREPWIREVIDNYRSGRTPYADAEITTYVRDKTLHLVRPIKIRDATCMACHGKVADAPAGMVRIYGNTHGYGWKMDEIVGVQAVTVPLDRSKERSAAAFQRFLWPLVAVFTLLFATLNILLQYWVLSPLSRQNLNLNRLATTDSLTGILNRRAFMDQFQLEMEAARYKSEPLSVLVFDLDHFKAINDTHGHAQGDQVLRTTANLVKGALRSNDQLARIGGEEFALLLPHTSTAGAHGLAENLRKRMEHQSLQNSPATTGSFGIATWDGRESRERLLKRADEAMYAAKAAGRNCIVADEGRAKTT
ncbi:diguanylate cyclase [Undibacterium sp. Ji83W]|uniref:diguanylate cyclase n=1 Tax=Undibacterium sp. Ji83W TaxID=3413043 RepID=UPI003BF2A15B